MAITSPAFRNQALPEKGGWGEGKSMEELQVAIRAFNDERNWERYHSPKNLAMALSVECAELCEHFQWLTQGESRDPDKKTRGKIADEIGDVQIYLACLADKLGINPIEAARAKMKKNAVKYPAPKEEES